MERSKTKMAAVSMFGHMTLCFLLVSCVMVKVITAQVEDSEELSECKEALGMHSGAIPDSAVTASSAYDIKSVGPLNARSTDRSGKLIKGHKLWVIQKRPLLPKLVDNECLKYKITSFKLQDLDMFNINVYRIRTERHGGAWCPKNQISRGVFEWIQIDLGNLTVISHVETQGRFGNGQGQEFAPEYLLEYQREENGNWRRFRNKKNREVFDGNKDTYTVVNREVRPPIIARKIRFVPYSDHPRTICMRIELYGCSWTDGVESYSMPQGNTRGSEVDFHDFSYDGQISDSGRLTGGLGQLVDMEEGENTFRIDKYGIGRKGYEWVAWKNESLSPTSPITMIFKFDTVRNFTAMKVHTNNFFSKEIRVFRMAKVYFSIGGEYYTQEPVIYEYLLDDLIELARDVSVPLRHRVGAFVKVEFFFADRWIMISEIRFDNEIADGIFDAEIAPPPTTSSKTPVIKYRILDTDDKNKDHTHTNPESIPPSERKNDDAYIGIIIGALAALIVLLAVIVLVIFIRHRKNKLKYTGSPLKMFIGHDHINFNLNDVGNGKVCNGNVYKGVATEDSDSIGKDNSLTKLTQALNGCDSYKEPIQTRRLPEVPSGGDLKDCCTPVSGEYASTDITQYSNLVVNLPPQPIYSQTNRSVAAAPPTVPVGSLGGDGGKEGTPQPPTPPPPPHPHDMCAAVGSSPDLNIQGLVGNSVYAVPNTELFIKDHLTLLDFPRENLRFVEKLGEGQFGEVHLCEALHITELFGDEFLINRTNNTSSMLVAVKMLRHNACVEARGDFNKEVQIMSRLKDPNIVRVLGVCANDEPMAVVVEYMKYGDLNQFLLQHVPEGTISRNHLTLSYGTLIYMATQVASGMKYLETLNMVHRDLATRNCLVGSNYTVKISDFGMSRSLYSRDYYRIEGKAILPIRWMAWESVLLGKFSTKSDVWSFAVTLWEILSLAREQPFASFNDDTVIENFGHYYRNNGQEVCLPMPVMCPKEIFDLMRECWNRDELLRPSFREIHMFLQRKNMGYDPLEERQGSIIRAPQL